MPRHHRPGAEESVHVEIVARLRLAGYALFHCPNGSASVPQYRAKLARLGVAPGIPDLIIAPARPGDPCAALELKSATGRLSPEQTVWLGRLQSWGWRAAYARGLDGALEQLRAWGYQV